MGDTRIGTQSWVLLLALSVIWGGSYLFIGIVVKELPALLIVLARVALATAILVPVHLLIQGRIPLDRRTLTACGVMSILNNAIPFSLIAWGQHLIDSGLAAVLNATTPMFAAVIMASTGLEAMTGRKILALCIGVLGVLILKGGGFGDLGAQSLGVLALILAAASYGAAAAWSKHRLTGISPLTTATLQLAMSTAIMTVVVVLFAEPDQYAAASRQTWIALVLLAVLSTAIAYLLFFRIIARAGPSFVSLVTMIVPVSAIVLGYLVLGERLTWQEVAGALIIGLALVIIDGRVLKWFGIKA